MAGYLTANSTLNGLVQSNTSGNSYFTGGNVGIGTSSPSEKLSVAGRVQSISGGFMFPDATVQQTAAPIIKSGTTTVGISIGPYSYFNIPVSFGYSF